MQQCTLGKDIGKQLAWLATWKQPHGYGGPVTHFWKDSFCYTGPGLDWRYEGIMTALLTLYEKTGEKRFLQNAIEAGNDLVYGQLRNGKFLHSGFDGNPSGTVSSMPHDTAASVGLMRLAIALKAKKNPLWQRYFDTAKKNLELFHFGMLYEPSSGLFLQSEVDKRRLHVPNKHATLAELFLLLFEMTHNQEYLRYAERCASFVVSQQDHDQFPGGIYQTDKRKHLIPLYIARCVPSLLAVHGITKKEKYLHAALDAVEFLKTMASPKGGFYFGMLKEQDTWHRSTYPKFVAGAGDILRAFVLVRPHKKYAIAKHYAWLQRSSHAHGGVWTSWGMNQKGRTIKKEITTPFWRDVLPVVGWNDKALRLRADMLAHGTTIPEASFAPSKMKCADGTYEEDAEQIVITDEIYGQRVFRKEQELASVKWFFAPLFALGAQRVLPAKVWETVHYIGHRFEPLHKMQS